MFDLSGAMHRLADCFAQGRGAKAGGFDAEASNRDGVARKVLDGWVYWKEGGKADGRDCLSGSCVRQGRPGGSERSKHTCMSC